MSPDEGIKHWQGRESGQASALVDELLTLMEDLHMNLDLAITELTSAIDYARNTRRKLWWVIQKSWEESDMTKQQLLPGKTSYYDDDHGLYVYSRGIGEGAFSISYGFPLNPDQQLRGWQLTFPNEGLPFAFVSLYKYEGADQFQKDYAMAINRLFATDGWHAVDAQFIARKLFPNMDFNQADLGAAYKDFFVRSINEIVEAFRQQ